MSHVEPGVEQTISESALNLWAQAISHIASHYRVTCSPGAIQANAPWFAGKNKPLALTQLARRGGAVVSCAGYHKTAVQPVAFTGCGGATRRPNYGNRALQR